MSVSAFVRPPGQRLVDAMRQLAGGVSVITTGRSPNRTGYTGTAVFSLSVDPERVVISVAKSSSSFSVIRDTGAFGLNILSSDQQAIADRFAGRGGVKGEARYDGATWIVAPSGVSLLASALANVECAVEEIIERHSHALIIGETLSVVADSSPEALIFWRSRYGSSNAAARLAAE
jgi:flavin reductase (DIM6/NTAB) family NADH-FMN oxidoreductase RutF